MKELKAIKDFSLNNKIYVAGDIIETNNVNEIILLNEKGFIEPLNAKDLQDYDEYFKNKNKKKKEVVEDDTII